MNHRALTIYTDGSCNASTRKGGWAAIIVSGENKTILQGTENETTHNRMELTAVLKAIDYALAYYPETPLEIFTDSQYVFHLPNRMEKLLRNEFITKKGNVLHNSDLIRELTQRLKTSSITFHKVTAHRKSNGTENLNREADMICRRVMREN